MEGFKVLHLDRNEYYGGEGASLSLSQVNGHGLFRSLVIYILYFFIFPCLCSIHFVVVPEV